ncbi:unnamed protein product [Adineta ricciae]|uniref:Uncharacterized protein n=1 Tax=Adineta ricciae TaxID=249248 RepID=A0A815WYI3_ADIRI|nr:unnamed protein product [Adineta ricciae]
MFVFYKETTRTLKYSSTRRKRKASTLLSSTPLITTAVVTAAAAAAAQHRRCYLSSSSSTSSTVPSYSVLIFSAADILFRLTEAFVGQVEEVQKNCFRKIMNSRHSNQENSSIYEMIKNQKPVVFVGVAVVPVRDVDLLIITY